MNLLFDCERMKHRYVGLYSYCLHLGQALERVAGAGDSVTYYVDPAIGREAFGPGAGLLRHTQLHKLHFPVPSRCDVWHGVEQRSPYAPSRRGLKRVLTIHDLNFLHEPGSDARRIARNLKIVQRNVDRADHLITISEFVKREVQERLDLGNKPISVVYNGCQRFPDTIPERPRFVPDAPFLFAIGVITDKKNWHVLPRILVGNELRLIIAGTVAKKAYLERILEEAARLGVRERVLLPGGISEDEKRWCYAHCAAFVFPSLAEGFGLPVVEAMSFGRPVFLSTATSLPEVGGEDAYYFESFDPEAMQRVFERGMSDHASDPEAKARRIRARSERFSWENCARDCWGIYRGLVD